MDLKLAHSNDEDIVYQEKLELSVSAISPTLLLHDIWNKELVFNTKSFVNYHVGSKSSIGFDNLPTLPKLELKLYWARLLSDERNNSRSIIERRIKPMVWLNTKWAEISRVFSVNCISTIPHPELKKDGLVASESKKQHNLMFLELFELYTGGHASAIAESAVNGEIKLSEYKSPRITVAGAIHKEIVIQREQFEPLKNRNIIYLNDIYSEEDTRFKDRQRQGNTYLNHYLYPEWMRDAVRTHILQKVEYGELAPSTVKNTFARYLKFRDFLYDKFDDPHPFKINNTLVEDDFIAWGNEKGLVGKNWWTDTVAMLNTAAKSYPALWPKLSIESRKSKRISKVHYKKGLGRIGNNSEGAGRSYSLRIVNEIARHIQTAPLPCAAVFALILATGARSEDGHAILFNCLKEDQNDSQFMLLTFWQNKVSRWNIKPLLKSDKAHRVLIETIRNQQKEIISKYGAPTKYLFPVYTGTKESYIDANWTRTEIKKRCIKHNIRSEEGKLLDFSWHPLRHTKGSSMAAEGHDILSIMMELGHASPDMATVYVNNRLELKKKALIEKGGGRFFNIEGKVDVKIGELLVKKDQLKATRVCGGACSMPAQIGDWCEHANACYTCKYFRADSNDINFFKAERKQIIDLVEIQSVDINNYQETGRQRLAEITSRRRNKNIEISNHLESIVNAISSDETYVGTEQKSKKMSIT